MVNLTHYYLVIIQVWGTLIMQKTYKGRDYLLAFLVTLGCSVFILYPVITVFISPILTLMFQGFSFFFFFLFYLFLNNIVKIWLYEPKTYLHLLWLELRFSGLLLSFFVNAVVLSLFLRRYMSGWRLWFKF